MNCWNNWSSAGTCVRELGCDLFRLSQIAKFMGPTWGPPGSHRPQIGPMLAPRTLLSGMAHHLFSAKILPETKETIQHSIVHVVANNSWINYIISYKSTQNWNMSFETTIHKLNPDILHFTAVSMSRPCHLPAMVLGWDSSITGSHYRQHGKAFRVPVH